MFKLGFYFNSIKHFRLFRNIIYKIRCNNLYRKEFSDKEYLIRLGKIRLGYKMNLDNPQTLNEKLNWYKLNYCSDLMRRVVDKFEVKKYGASKGLSNILIKTIRLYDDVNDISLEELPNKFVVKNTMDSGGVFLCKNKVLVNKLDIVKKLDTVVNFRNGKHINRETAYTEKNNRVIIEEMIEMPDGHIPMDYKFFCFNGEPKFLYVTSNREKKTNLDFFDISFNHINCKHVYPNSNKNILKPKNFDKMLEICKILSKDFPHVRVDLYNIDGKVYFGELTFYTSGGFGVFRPKKWDKEFGNYWDLTDIIK